MRNNYCICLRFSINPFIRGPGWIFNPKSSNSAICCKKEMKVMACIHCIPAAMKRKEAVYHIYQSIVHKIQKSVYSRHTQVFSKKVLRSAMNWSHDLWKLTTFT